MPSAAVHSSAWATIRARGKALAAVRGEQPAGMVEVEVGEGHDVDRARVEAGCAQRGQDGLAAHAALGSMVLVHALADAGLDEDAPARRLDEQAVERLGERVVGVELVGDEALPHDPRHRAQERAGVAREGARLDERDAWMPPPSSARQSRARIDGASHASVCSRAALARRCVVPRSRGTPPTASASTGPGSAEPSPFEPYGRSTGLDISKNEIWPMRMPCRARWAGCATFESSSVRLPFQPGST